MCPIVLVVNMHASQLEVDVASSDGNGLGNNGYGSLSLPRRDFVTVQSLNVAYTENEILSRYTYSTASVMTDDTRRYVATPQDVQYNLKIDRKVPRVGAMFVGWGGNNGTTVNAGIIANRSNLS
jgi:myo-inositol-1-phosphate synthase